MFVCVCVRTCVRACVRVCASCVCVWSLTPVHPNSKITITSSTRPSAFTSPIRPNPTPTRLSFCCSANLTHWVSDGGSYWCVKLSTNSVSVGPLRVLVGAFGGTSLSPRLTPGHSTCLLAGHVTQWSFFFFFFFFFSPDPTFFFSRLLFF